MQEYVIYKNRFTKRNEVCFIEEIYTPIFRNENPLLYNLINISNGVRYNWVSHSEIIDFEEYIYKQEFLLLDGSNE